MSTNEQQPDSQWPPPWARVIAFLLGLALTGWETAVDHVAHLPVYGIAWIFTGLPLARGVEALLERLGLLFGKGPTPASSPTSPSEPAPPAAPKPNGKP